MSDEITILDTLVAIRKRPGMYVGDLSDGSGLHRMLFWTFEDILANCRAGRGSLIKVYLHDDGAVTIADDGPALPEGENTLEERLEAMTKKFDGGGPDKGIAPETQVRSGLPILRALSSTLEIRFSVHPDSRTVSYVTEKGVLKDGEWDDHARMGGEGAPEGLHMGLLDTNFVVKFWPDDEVFTDTKIDYEFVRTRLQQMAATSSEFKAELYDEREDRHETIEMSNGMADMLAEVTKKSEEYSSSFEPEKPFHLRVHSGEISFDVAIRWHWGHQVKEPVILSWANTEHTAEGPHILGLKEALWSTGLDGVPYFATLSVFVPQPQFVNACRNGLRNPEIRQMVRDHLIPALRRLKNTDEFALRLDWMEVRRAQLADESFEAYAAEDE